MLSLATLSPAHHYLLLTVYPGCQKVLTFASTQSPLSGRNCSVVSILTPIVVDRIHILIGEIPTSFIVLSLHTSLSPQFPRRLRSCLSSLLSKEMRAPNVCDDTAHMYCVGCNGLSVRTCSYKIFIYTLCEPCSVLLRVYTPCA